jgi:hypothetical protein
MGDMLAFLLFLIGFFPLVWVYGRAGVSLAARLSAAAPRADWALTAWVGLAMLSTLANLLSLLMPLSAAALLITLVIALIAALALRRTLWLGLPALRLPRGWGWLAAGLALAALAAVLENATHTPANFDSGLYHAQTIRWFETYRIVPGLGNLHSRLAFNSSWLVLSALFSLAFTGLQSFHLIPGALFALAVLDGARGALRLLRGELSMANWLRLLLLPLAFYILGAEISSPGTDMPGILIAWSLAALWLERPARGEERLTALLLALTAVYLLTIKLSLGVLLLLVPLAWLRGGRGLRLAVQIVLGGALVALPWMAHSVILSGYLVYPLAAVDLFNVDWKIPIAKVREEVNVIRAWARFPDMDRTQALEMPLERWLKLWFLEHTVNQRLILLAAAASPLLGGAAALWTRLRRRWAYSAAAAAQLYAVTLLSGLYWLYNAPDLRFGYGILLLLITLPLAWGLWLAGAAWRAPADWLARAAVLAVGVYLLSFLARSFQADSLAQRWLLPMPYPSLPSEPCDLDGRTIFCPAEISYTQCWYGPFPCVPSARSDVYLRGSDFADGFSAYPRGE